MPSQQKKLSTMELAKLLKAGGIHLSSVKGTSSEAQAMSQRQAIKMFRDNGLQAIPTAGMYKGQKESSMFVPGAHPKAIDLADKIAKHTGQESVLINSPSEVNEAHLKHGSGKVEAIGNGFRITDKQPNHENYTRFSTHEGPRFVEYGTGHMPVAHYGKEGMKELDPAMQGTGADRQKFMKTGKPETPYSSAYNLEAQPEDRVLAQSGSKAHVANVEPHRLYDITKDPEGHLAQAQSDLASGRAEGNPADFQDLARGRIKAAGYHGLKRASGASDKGSVELFHKTPVYATGGRVAPGTNPRQASEHEAMHRKIDEGIGQKRDMSQVGGASQYIKSMNDIPKQGRLNDPDQASFEFIRPGVAPRIPGKESQERHLEQKRHDAFQKRIDAQREAFAAVRAQEPASESLPDESDMKREVRGEAKSKYKAKGFTGKDVDPDITHTPAQKRLVHGINLSNMKALNGGVTGNYSFSGMTKNKHGQDVIVKGPLPQHSLDLGDEYTQVNTAQREGLYHNAAHMMGLGKFVPATAVIKREGDATNKKGGKDEGPAGHISVMARIPNAEHYDSNNQDHADIVDEHHQRGDLHKLALMNTILGNSDRHNGNWMISPEGIHMIDHGLTFHYHENSRDVYTPKYIHAGKDSSGDEELQDEYMHPKAASWLKNLKVADFKKFAKDNKMPANFSKYMINALQAGKKELEYQEKHNAGEVYFINVIKAMRSKFDSEVAR